MKLVLLNTNRGQDIIKVYAEINDVVKQVENEIYDKIDELERFGYNKEGIKKVMENQIPVFVAIMGIRIDRKATLLRYA